MRRLAFRKRLLTAIGEGEADVTVSLGTVTATCHVVVAKPEIKELILSKSEVTLKPDGTGQLKATVDPSEAMNYYDVIWTSSDTSVVTVEPESSYYKNYGCLTAVGEGEADVTVTIGTKTIVCHVIVAE